MFTLKIFTFYFAYFNLPKQQIVSTIFKYSEAGFESLSYGNYLVTVFLGGAYLWIKDRDNSYASERILVCNTSSKSVLASVVDPKLFFSDPYPDPTFKEIPDPT